MSVDKDRARILAYLEARVAGATDEEIALDLGMPANSLRPRRLELVHMGRVRDSGRKRRLASGNEGTVWERCDEVPRAHGSKLKMLREAVEPFALKAASVADRNRDVDDHEVVAITVSLGACRALVEIMQEQST